MEAKVKRGKKIGGASTASNLVGMWAIARKGNGKDGWALLYIRGKCGSSSDGNDFYIVQAVDFLLGLPNIGRIYSLLEMKEWTFLPYRDLANEVIKDILEEKAVRYKWMV